VTEDSSFKRAARARMAETGERYTVARRALLEVAARRPEPYYRFTAPRTIERIDATRTLALAPDPDDGPSFAWGYAGSGPNTTARAVLVDATGDCDLRLAIAFAEDNLAWDLDSSFVITIAEVRAWRLDRQPDIRQQPRGRTYTAQEWGQLLMDHLNGDGLDRPWWRQYRNQFGEPRLD
jgi:hypothetical protein